MYESDHTAILRWMLRSHCLNSGSTSFSQVLHPERPDHRCYFSFGTKARGVLFSPNRLTEAVSLSSTGSSSAQDALRLPHRACVCQGAQRKYDYRPVDLLIAAATVHNVVLGVSKIGWWVKLSFKYLLQSSAPDFMVLVQELVHDGAQLATKAKLQRATCYNCHVFVWT